MITLNVGIKTMLVHKASYFLVDKIIMNHGHPIHQQIRLCHITY